MNWRTVIRECARTDDIFGIVGCALLALFVPFIAAVMP